MPEVQGVNLLLRCRRHVGDDPVQRAGPPLRANHQVPRHTDPRRPQASPFKKHSSLRPQARECFALFKFGFSAGKNVFNMLSCFMNEV